VAQREAALERLGSRLEVKGGALASMAIALVLHVGVGGSAIGIVMLSELWTWHSALLAKLQVRILDDYQVDIVKDEEPPPPPEPEPPKEEPKPETPPPTPEKAVEPPPQAAAQAAKVLVAEPKPDEPLDMTNVMVQGTGDTYTGGTTSATGTGKTAVRGPAAAAGGATGGTGNVGTQTAGVDKSRGAGVSGSSDWDCPFPPEADALQEDLAFVMIKVAVAADGKPTKVTVTKDPGHGFAREARTCAMQKRFLTALDAAGNAVAGETKEFRVRFER
jgi:protein TonB